MNTIDELIELADESQEIARRLALVKMRIGNIGAPELADLGGGGAPIVRHDVKGYGGGGPHGSAAASAFSSGPGG